MLAEHSFSRKPRTEDVQLRCVRQHELGVSRKEKLVAREEPGVKAHRELDAWMPPERCAPSANVLQRLARGRCLTVNREVREETVHLGRPEPGDHRGTLL